MGALEVPRISVEEYLAADEGAEIPSEYHDGVMLPIEMAGVPHGTISANVVIALGAGLRSSPCRPLIGPRLRVTARRYVYPDIAVVCGKANIVDKAGTFDNPAVIFEVLSPSTKGYDHSDKFKLYRMIESFVEYVLVSQDEPYVQVVRRQADRNWLASFYQGLDASFHLESLKITIPLAEIYANVTFEDSPELA